MKGPYRNIVYADNLADSSCAVKQGVFDKDARAPPQGAQVVVMSAVSGSVLATTLDDGPLISLEVRLRKTSPEATWFTSAPAYKTGKCAHCLSCVWGDQCACVLWAKPPSIATAEWRQSMCCVVGPSRAQTALPRLRQGVSP